uniref:Protein kinase domain-containing protein n=1 Tax=Alexandrium monilatum TaxID=311494 RepID=A0A7S4Q029_9DINO
MFSRSTTASTSTWGDDVLEDNDGLSLSSLQKLACGELSPTHFDVSDIQRWEPGRFRFERMVQKAPRNKGQVDHMFDVALGQHVAVKMVPDDWVCESHELFKLKFPCATECPWVDLGISAFLMSIEYPYVCPLHGVYRSPQDTMHIVTDLASEGDLFDWSTHLELSPGLEREASVMPLAKQLMDAVRHLHDLQIVHRDLSMENVLVTRGVGDDTPRIQLIDFAMSSRERYVWGDDYGRPQYQAPEAHSGEMYDGFLSDAFAVGVVICSILTQEYLWASTRPGKCKIFDYYSACGFTALAARRKCFGRRLTLSQCMSEPVIRLLEGLLALSPARRFNLGEDAGFRLGRGSLWQELSERSSTVATKGACLRTPGHGGLRRIGSWASRGQPLPGSFH